MEMSGQIILNNSEWDLLYRNLTAPSAEYLRSLNDYMCQISQHLEVEDLNQETIIRSDQIDFEGLFAALNGESIEKRTVEDSLSTVKDTEWMSNDTYASCLNGSRRVRNASYFSSTDSNLSAA